MTEDSGATPTPYVLDVSVLVAVARADAEVTRLVITLDGRRQPLVIPVLAITAASLDTRTETGSRLLGLRLRTPPPWTPPPLPLPLTPPPRPNGTGWE